MRNDAGIGKVVHSGQPLLCHGQRCREHLRQYRHGIGDVHHPLVLDDLRHKVAVDQIVRDGHTNPQGEAVGIALEHLLHISLGFAVKRLGKVGEILLRKSDAGAQWVFVVILKDTAGGVDGAMNALRVAKVRHIESANDVDADRFWLVIFAPIDVGAAGNARRHEDVTRLDVVELGLHVSPVFNPRFGEKALHS